MKELANKIVNAVLFPFGRCNVTLGQSSGKIIDQAIDAIRNCGGEKTGESGPPTSAIEVLHFRVRGHRVRLTIIECGDVSLSGPKQLVRDLAAQIAV